MTPSTAAPMIQMAAMAIARLIMYEYYADTNNLSSVIL